MRVVHVIKSVNPQAGGPSAVAVSLAAHQASLGIDVSIATELEPDTERSWDFWVTRIRNAGGIRLIPVRDVRHSHLLSGKSARHLHAANDVLHLHGVWDALIWSCLAAARRGAHVILAPHGMLSTWSMQQKKLKKRVILDTILRNRLRHASCIHVLNSAEREELHRLLPEVPTRVLPNGIDPTEFQRTSPVPSTRLTGSCSRYVLSLARLHAMKGPDRLLEAFAEAVRTDARMTDVGLVLAGPDFGMAEVLRRRATELGIAHRVSLPGPVFGPDKHALLAGAACLCQPSRHEGFSVTLLEALAVGTPAIATPEANFPELATEGCGRVVEGDSAELARAIVEMIADERMHEQMSSAGKRLVHERYTWEMIARESIRLYVDAFARDAQNSFSSDRPRRTSSMYDVWHANVTETLDERPGERR